MECYIRFEGERPQDAPAAGVHIMRPIMALKQICEQKIKLKIRIPNEQPRL